MNTKSSSWWRAPLVAALALACAGAGAFTFVLNNRTGLPVKWPAGTVPIRIMLGTTPNLSDGTSYNGSAATAADIWNAQIGSIQLVATQAAPGPAGDGNNTNELVFASDAFGRKFGENVLALTTSNYDGNERRASDIIFNSAYTWDSYRGSRRGETVDLRRVALHELGHLLGLDHPDEDNQTVGAIMNSRITSVDTLLPDDIAGAQAIYGPPGVPANNHFANATTITLASGSLALTGYNTNATKEAGEPNHAANVGGRSVWWRWRPENLGDVTLDTKGSYYDTTLAVYTGTSLSSLTEVASDDDITDGVVQASTVSFRANGNTTYMIAVDGFNGDASGADNGGIKLNLTYAPTTGGIVITNQPQSTTVSTGASVTFSVTATGAAPISYQWYFNNAAINGATSASYALSNIQPAQGGTYTVTVTNPVSSVTSSGALLTVGTVTPPPPPSSGGGGGGGGGGGAPSVWFCAALAALGLARARQHFRA